MFWLSSALQQRIFSNLSNSSRRRRLLLHAGLPRSTSSLKQRESCRRSSLMPATRLTLHLQQLMEQLDQEAQSRAHLEEELVKERQANALLQEQLRKKNEDEAAYKQQIATLTQRNQAEAKKSKSDVAKLQDEIRKLNGVLKARHEEDKMSLERIQKAWDDCKAAREASTASGGT